MNLKEKGTTLNIGAGQMQWIENDLFLGNPSFISSDIDKENLGPQNLAAKKMSFDATDIPLKSNSVSQVIILDVLEHIKEDEKAISEIYRILKKGGRLIVCVPNDTFLSFFNPIRYLQHERHYTLQLISERLSRVGFTIRDSFSGGKVFELLDLYVHLFLKYTLRRMVKLPLLERLRDKEYSSHDPQGNEIIVVAEK